MSETTYVNGMLVKTSKFGYRVGIKSEDLIAFLAEHTDEKGWCNIEILTAKDTSKGYAKLDTWKPEKAAPSQPAEDSTDEDDSPF